MSTAPSPFRRKASLGEHDLNTAAAPPPTTTFESQKQSRASMPSTAFSFSPSKEKKMGRRSVANIFDPQKRPRKSILKGLAIPHTQSDDTIHSHSQGQSHAHTATFNFGNSSLSSGHLHQMHQNGEHTMAFPPRRVSFAPNAHVRMFENPPPKRPKEGRRSSINTSSNRRSSTGPSASALSGSSTNAFAPSSNTGISSSSTALGPRPSHSRRSSITSAAALALPQHAQSNAQVEQERFVGEGETQGEASMDMEETASEGSGSEGDEDMEMTMQSAGEIDADGDGDGSMDMEMSFAQGHSRARSSIQPFTLGARTSTGSRLSISAQSEGDMSIDGAGEDQGTGMEMEMTGVHGGIIRRPSLSSNSQSRTGTGTVTHTHIHVEQADVSVVTVTDAETDGDRSNLSHGTETDVDAAEDQTMDFTIAIGGVMPHSPPVHASKGARGSLGYSNPHFNVGGRLLPGMPTREEEEEEEEQGMMETMAYGGVIGEGEDETVSSAEGGQSMRRDGDGEGRTMTFSFDPANLAAQRQDEGEGDGMEMTVAMGGIVADRRSSVHTTSHNHTQTHTQTQNIGSTSLLNASRSSHANIFAPAPPTPQHAPAPPTPSFARPTVSSASKARSNAPAEKRNVFAPSPSPTKGTTPRNTTPKTGVEVAREVAKRLSFGFNPASASGSKKRMRNDDEERDRDTPGATPAKRRSVGGSVSGSVQRQTVGAGNVFTDENASARLFASTRTSRDVAHGQGQGRNALTPRKSLPSAVSAAAMRSPAKSPMLRKMIGAPPSALSTVSAIGVDNAWAPEAGEDADGEFEAPTITLGAFLNMAGVQFVEGIPVSMASTRGAGGRKSQGQRGMRASYAGDKEFALHEYAAASVESVFLNMYTWASNKMRSDIQTGQLELEQTEADCSIHNPPVIREYLCATDEDKVLFEMTFKAYKSNTQLKAKERWYDWKMGLIERVGPDVGEVLEGMREDTARLDEMQEQTQRFLPDLRAKLAALQEELVKEREAVREIEACDADELAELRTAVAEQDVQIKAFSSELHESTTQNDRLSTQLSELQSKRAEHVSAIAVARGLCDQYTKSDVLRLKDELESLQALHLWKVEKVESGGVVLNYDGEVRLHVQLADGKVGKDGSGSEVREVKVEMLEKIQKHGARGLGRVFEGAVMGLSKEGGLSLFIQRVGQLYSSVQKIRSELRLVEIHFPVSFRSIDHRDEELESESESEALEARASVMFPNLKSRVEVVFTIHSGVIRAWPEVVGEVEVKVETIYGGADSTSLSDAAKSTLSMGRSDGYLGAFLSTVLDVSSRA